MRFRCSKPKEPCKFHETLRAQDVSNSCSQPIIHPSPKSCWFYTHGLSLHRLVPRLLGSVPRLSFCFSSCCFQSIIYSAAKVISSKHQIPPSLASNKSSPNFEWGLKAHRTWPLPVSPASFHGSLPLGLCDPSTLAFHFHQHFHLSLPLSQNLGTCSTICLECSSSTLSFLSGSLLLVFQMSVRVLCLQRSIF